MPLARLRQDAKDISRNASQRSRLREQLATPRTIDAALRVRAVQSETEPRARLVCDRMKRDQRFAHPPIASIDQTLEWIIGPFVERLPLLGQQLGERTALIFDPRAPRSTRVLDRRWPADDPSWWPLGSGRWVQEQPMRLGALEDRLRQSEQVGGPLEELVADRTVNGVLPDRRRRQLL